LANHTIQLKGPWQLEIQDGQSQPLGAARLNIRDPNDWHTWSREFQEPLLDQARQVSFSRKFNWPAPHPAPAGVELVMAGAVPSLVILNEQTLPLDSDDLIGPLVRIPILPLLVDANHLCLNFCLPETNSDQAALALQFVRLEIHE